MNLIIGGIYIMKKFTIVNAIVCIISGIIIEVALVNNLLSATIECGLLPKSFPIYPVGCVITLIMVLLIEIKSDVFEYKPNLPIY